MKFVHIADVHLGVSPEAGKAYTERRRAEIWSSFAHIIDVCEEEQADILLIAGDLFHRQPLLRELKEVNYLFSKLSKTRVVMIAGNHDYIKRDSFYRTFKWEKNVFPLFQTELDFVEFEDLELCVYGFSYDRKEIPERRYDKAYAGKRQKYEILLAHGGDAQHIPFETRSLLSLGYDYIALGHIHKPAQVMENQICYPGALEPTEKNDLGKHGYIIGELGEDGTKVSFVPSAKREYVKAEMQVNPAMTGSAVRDEIRQMISDRGVENIYMITLTGERDVDILFDTAGMDSYGNIIELTDETHPAYDFEKLYRKNEKNLLGKYIESFAGAKVGSLEYQALYEGVQALMETKRGS